MGGLSSSVVVPFVSAELATARGATNEATLARGVEVCCRILRHHDSASDGEKEKRRLTLEGSSKRSDYSVQALAFA